MLNFKSNKFFQAALILIFILLYFKNSDIIINAVKQSLYLCYSTVIPSLFIFIVFSSYVSGISAFTVLSKPIKPFLKLLNINDDIITTYVILSSLGGFAVGGHFLAKIKERYPKEDNLIGVLSIIMSCNSPAFIIVAIGVGFLNNYKAGLIIYLSIAISTYLTAFVFSFVFPYSTAKKNSAYNICSQGLCVSIAFATKSILNICGVVIVAFTACKVISLYTHNPFLLSLFSGMLEVTTACYNINDLFGKNLYAFCIVLSVVPLSAVLQMKSFFKASVSFKILYISKFLQIPLSLIVLRVLANFFPYAVATSGNNNFLIKTYWNSPYISCCLLVFSIAFVIFFDKSIGIFTNLKK